MSDAAEITNALARNKFTGEMLQGMRELIGTELWTDARVNAASDFCCRQTPDSSASRVPSRR